MKSAYDKITTYTGNDFEGYLKVQDIARNFWDLFDRFKAEGYAQTIVLYIVHCYSVESDFATRGGTWMQVKSNVAKYVELPDHLYDLVVYLGQHTKWDEKIEGWEENRRLFNLQLQAVTSAISNYMSYEDNRENRHLKILNDLYEEQLTGMNDSKNSYDEKDKCRKRAAETLKDIQEIENGMKNRLSNTLKDGLRDLARVPQSLRPEIAARKF